MVLDFAKDAIDDSVRLENIRKVKAISNVIETRDWTNKEIETFILGYKLGKAEGGI